MSTRRKRTRSLIIFASGMVLVLQIFVGCKPVNKGFSGEMAYNHVAVSYTHLTLPTTPYV